MSDLNAMNNDHQYSCQVGHMSNMPITSNGAIKNCQGANGLYRSKYKKINMYK